MFTEVALRIFIVAGYNLKLDYWLVEQDNWK